jgi:molybdenum-dependent DNA-binding transcriptional regulator ModE
LVEEAVGSLVVSRGGGRGDAGAVLSALASLIAETQRRLPDAVADARDQEYTWAEIAARLATTTSVVSRRYRDYIRWRAGLAVGET